MNFAKLLAMAAGKKSGGGTGTGPGTGGTGGMNYRGVYDSAQAYKPNDVVKFSGRQYVCKAATTPVPPPPNTISNATLSFTGVYDGAAAHPLMGMPPELIDGKKDIPAAIFADGSQVTISYPTERQFNVVNFYGAAGAGTYPVSAVSSASAYIDRRPVNTIKSYDVEKMCLTIAFPQTGAVGKELMIYILVGGSKAASVTEMEVCTGPSAPNPVTSPANWEAVIDAVASSTGTSDSCKIVMTGSKGMIDDSMLPPITTLAQLPDVRDPSYEGRFIRIAATKGNAEAVYMIAIAADGTRSWKTVVTG